MKTFLLNEYTKKMAYLLLGSMIMLVGLSININNVNREKENQMVYQLSLQSCFFNLTKKAGMNPDISTSLCDKYSTDTMNTYSEISIQMDKITDKKYAPIFL